MNKYKKMAFGILALLFVLPVFQVHADFDENTTTVGNSSVVAKISSDNFSEDTTKVGNPTAQASASGSFSEDTTTVGNPATGADSLGGFGEDTTTVGNPPANDNDTPTASSRSRSGSRRTSSAPTGNLSAGEVLGASTDDASCKMLTTFMKLGTSNNVEEVKTLQTFLNSEMNAGLPVTGFFGPLTFQIVKNFQAKYAEDVLKPWVNVGLMEDETPTGYMYKTTQYTINKMLCPEADIAKPVLN